MTGRSGNRCLISPRSVHAGHVDVGENREQPRLDFTREPIQRFIPRRGIMQDIRALTDLATKPLPKELGHVGLVVDDQDAKTHKVVPAVVVYWERGKRTVNSVNSPSRLSTSIVPPCCWVTMS